MRDRTKLCMIELSVHAHMVHARIQLIAYQNAMLVKMVQSFSLLLSAFLRSMLINFYTE